MTFDFSWTKSSFLDVCLCGRQSELNLNRLVPVDPGSVGSDGRSCRTSLKIPARRIFTSSVCRKPDFISNVWNRPDNRFYFGNTSGVSCVLFAERRWASDRSRTSAVWCVSAAVSSSFYCSGPSIISAHRGLQITPHLNKRGIPSAPWKTERRQERERKTRNKRWRTNRKEEVSEVRCQKKKKERKVELGGLWKE